MAEIWGNLVPTEMALSRELPLLIRLPNLLVTPRVVVLRVLQSPAFHLECYYLVTNQNFQILSEDRKKAHASV